MEKPLKQTFIQGIITLVLSQVFIKILGLVYKLYLTNKEGFGDAGNAIYNSGFQIYALLLTVSSIGIPNAVSKLVSEKMAVKDYFGADRIFKVTLLTFSIVGFCVANLLFFYADYIANVWLQIPEAVLTLKILAPSIFFVSIISAFRGYFNGKGNMKPTANSQIVEQLVKTICTILLVEIIYTNMIIQNKTEIMAAVANLATTLATIIGFIYLYKCYINENKKIKTNKNALVKKEKIRLIMKNIIIVAMPMTITAILGGINKNIDSITVIRGLKNFLTLEEAQVEYGILSGKVDTLTSLPMSFNIALATVLVPAIAGAKAKNNIEEVKEKTKFSILITILIGLPCTVGMILFAKPILNLLFPNANSGELILQMSALSIIFIVLNQTINGILQGIGKQLVPVISIAIGVIVKLIINIVLVPINPERCALGGTVGATLGTLGCYVIATGISLIILRKNLKIKFNINKFLIKPIIITIIMGIISVFLYIILNKFLNEKIVTIISIFIGVIIYFFMIKLFNIFSKKELNALLITKKRHK